jgi:hypothetical protein
MITVVNDIDITQKRVLDYLKKLKIQYPDSYNRLTIFGLKPNDIIKYIERPEDCGRWPFDFVAQVNFAITKISKKYLIDFPDIELQTEEDRVLSKILKKNNFFAFDSNTFFGAEITVHHVIAYMERDSAIYNWNAYFINQVRQEVKRVKEYLLE